MPHLWLRAETKTGEHRTPLTPEGAVELLQLGFRISVEESSQRVFTDQEYLAAGCELVPNGTWEKAPNQAFILGLKELPGSARPIRHRHIFFAHAFKGQPDARALLSRFLLGGGQLLDLEYLTDETNRRVAAFGYWAGYVGASLSLLAWFHRSKGRPLPALKPYADAETLRAEISELKRTLPRAEDSAPKALIIGAKGRSGSGATDAFKQQALTPLLWDLEETQNRSTFPELYEQDIVVNCVLVSKPMPPFITTGELQKRHKPNVIADVSCDPYHPNNPFPVYSECTTWEVPEKRIQQTQTSLLAIDNLPSLLPKESSQDFAQQLLPHLKSLPRWSTPWKSSLEQFTEHCKNINP